MSTERQRQQPKPAPGFEVIESYEKMLEQRRRDPLGYQLQHSLAEKYAAEH